MLSLCERRERNTLCHHSSPLSVTDEMPVGQRGDNAQLWVLPFDWLFFFNQFATRNAALLKPDLSARGGFSANCRC